ncbi:MAG: adenylate kinase [Opitutaceae bacterium]|nr:adenylate kinase [Opitutaceae bacterium]
MKRAEHSSAFSAFATAKAKFLLLGPTGPHLAGLASQVRSLNLEHVSPASLVQQEISRRTPSVRPGSTPGVPGNDQVQLALLRKWFWARKPDAGFLLEGFPATLLQALVFDEWLEARGENLTAVFAVPLSAGLPVSGEVATYYRTQGVPFGTLPAAA